MIRNRSNPSGDCGTSNVYFSCPRFTVRLVVRGAEPGRSQDYHTRRVVETAELMKRWQC